jgi:hypothetical protein
MSSVEYGVSGAGHSRGAAKHATQPMANSFMRDRLCFCASVERDNSKETTLSLFCAVAVAVMRC